MDVGCAVLTALEQPLRDNIAQMGRLALEKFSALQTKYPAIITKVQGTGLLFSVSLAPEVANVVGENGIEKQLRQNGIGVIHGGHNALRFTPHFGLTEAELDLMVSEVDKVFAPLS
jgi:acetylornithine/succinyldiaminopimelate/putrescine aminotransferase